jgi:hypothetical protein
VEAVAAHVAQEPVREAAASAQAHRFADHAGDADGQSRASGADREAVVFVDEVRGLREPCAELRPQARPSVGRVEAADVDAGDPHAACDLVGVRVVPVVGVGAPGAQGDGAHGEEDPSGGEEATSHVRVLLPLCCRAQSPVP